MNSADKTRILQRYDARLAKFGYDIRSLASGTEERRNLRFKVLCEIGVANDCRLLDLGCGFGDLYSFLRSSNLRVDYTGYDINPKLIEIARQNQPNAAFEVKDIQKEPFPEFDYIVSTSTFNLRLQQDDNYEFIANVLSICYQHAQRGVAVDFLSSYVDYVSSEEVFHYSPERVFSIAKKIARRVSLRHDYPLYEFCIYLHADSRE